MTAKKKPDKRVQFDWAGPHGTAWGTVNACLTVVSATSVAHVFAHLPPLVAGAAGLAGILAVLIRAAARTKRTPPGTVVYQVSCWAAAAGWAAWMLSIDHWSWRFWAQGVGILAAGAIAAGILAAVASHHHDDTAPAAEPPGSWNSRYRLALAEEWEARIARNVNGLPVRIEAIERWDGGHGYTLQGVLPEGGAGVDDLRQAATRLANDANLPEGCQITVYKVPGGLRRQFLMDVSTRHGLGVDQDYPADITPLSINNPIPIGNTPSFDTETLELRQRCVEIIGETGSGKTNLLHDVNAGLVRCVDVIVFGIDLTGGGLFRPWLRAWEAGRAARPAITAVADTPEKAMRMCRAILRVGHGRKSAYQELMYAVDDDKLPIGHLLDEEHLLPEVMLVVDEIASITGVRSAYPDLRDLIVKIMQELRASGCRVILAGLRATDEVITQSIETLCHTRIGMKVTSKAELAWLFGNAEGMDPADIPDVGMGFIKQHSTDKPTPMRTYRLTPSVIERIAMAAADPRDGWIPEMDPISRALANGRDPETGQPLPGVKPEDLDWYECRWDGWDQADATSVAASPADPQIPPIPPEYQPKAGTVATLDEIRDAAEAANRALEDRIAEAKGQDAQQVRRDREVFAEIVGANWGDELDYNDPSTWSRPPETTPPATTRERLLELLVAAGPEGMSPKNMLGALADGGMVIARDTLHEHLKKLLADGYVARPRFGRWAWTGKTVNEPEDGAQ